jgi:hypothetical protein
MALAFVGSGLLAATTARSALVAPGETVRLRSADFRMPAGQVLAEEAAPFFLVLEAEGYDSATAVPGTLTSTVLRERATGRLTFAYAINFAGQGNDGAGGGAQQSRLSVTGFGSFTANLAARLAFEPDFPCLRSGDGSTLTVESDTPGQGGSPTLLVGTDATEFDAGGVLQFAAADPFLLPGPVEGSGAAGGMVSVLASGEVELSGVFRPIAGGQPSPVPLPPAVFSGRGTLIACALLWAGWTRGRRGR